MAEEKRKRILSGIQPTGTPTLGNYIGAVRNWALLQSDYECLYMVADLHSLTVRQVPAELRRRPAAGRGHRPEKPCAFCAEPCTRAHPAVLGAGLQHPVRRAVPHDPVQRQERQAPRQCQRRPVHLPGADGGRHLDLQRRPRPGRAGSDPAP